MSEFIAVRSYVTGNKVAAAGMALSGLLNSSGDRSAVDRAAGPASIKVSCPLVRDHPMSIGSGPTHLGEMCSRASLSARVFFIGDRHHRAVAGGGSWGVAWHARRISWRVDRPVDLGVSDLLMSFPSLLLGVMIAAALGPSFQSAVIAIAIALFPRFVRLARAATQVVRREPFIDASIAAGRGTASIMLRHVLPNIGGSLVVALTLWGSPPRSGWRRRCRSSDWERNHPRRPATLIRDGMSDLSALRGPLPVPERRSRWRCCRSTWSATRCMIYSIPRSTHEDGRFV